MNNKESSFNIKQIINRLGPLISLIVLFVAISAVNSNFLTINNMLNLLRQVAVNGLIAFGMTFVIMTGGIDLSVGSTLALASAFSVKLIASGANSIIAILIGLIAGVLLGAINGGLVSYGKMPPFIATLATMTIYRGATLVFTDGNPITVSDSGIFSYIGRGFVGSVPVPVIVLLIVFVILYVVLHKTVFGRKLFSIGGNETAANIAGVDVNKSKIKAYAISGFTSALAGIILASRLSSAQPTAGTAFETDAIAAVVIGGSSMSGGRGNLFGTVIGALIIGTISNGLNLMGVSSFYQDIVKGIVIIVAMLMDRSKDD